jgi:hypothetical protein
MLTTAIYITITLTIITLFIQVTFDNTRLSKLSLKKTFNKLKSLKQKKKSTNPKVLTNG